MITITIMAAVAWANQINCVILVSVEIPLHRWSDAGAVGLLVSLRNRKQMPHSRIRYPYNYLGNVLELPKMHSQPFIYPH